MDTRLLSAQTAKRTIRTVAKTMCSLVLITIIGAASCLAYWRLEGKMVMSVQSASMVPTFRPGDAIIAEPIRTRRWQPGDVISYRNPHTPKMIITHRLIKIDKISHRLTSQGDALNTPDQTFSDRFVAGKVTTVLPGFGRLLNTLRHPLGLLALVYLPALTLIGYEIQRWNNNHIYRSH